MASNNNDNNDKPMSEETREDVRRMTAGLTDQITIETLSRAGMVAKNKRENSQAHRSQAKARAEAAKKEAAKKAAEDEEKQTDGDNVKDEGFESDQGKNKKQI
ncbi:hypothetical protein FGRMN_1478 [Fusarium graminum]|nr:hypothetical protein FGRMN_1478 [Fusarium graminum]